MSPRAIGQLSRSASSTSMLHSSVRFLDFFLDRIEEKKLDQIPLIMRLDKSPALDLHVFDTIEVRPYRQVVIEGKLTELQMERTTRVKDCVVRGQMRANATVYDYKRTQFADVEKIPACATV